MTCEINIGFIYKVAYPFTDLSGKKIRPTLALTVADERGDAYFAFITTKPYANVESFYLEEADYLDDQALPRSSYLSLNKTMLLNRSVVEGEVAKLNKAMMQKVARAQVKHTLPLSVSLEHGQKSFIPSESVVPVSGKVVALLKEYVVAELPNTGELGILTPYVVLFRCVFGVNESLSWE